MLDIPPRKKQYQCKNVTYLFFLYICFYRYPSVPFDEEAGQLVLEFPISVALTEFHFVLLYKDRIRAICQLNDQIVYEEMIPLVSNKNKTTTTKPLIK